MALRHSHQLVEILRNTLAKIENDPATDSSGEEIARLKRDLVRWIAEAESVDIAENEAVLPVPEGVSPVTPPPAKKAIDLAVALISQTPAAEPTEAKPVPEIEGPAAA